MGLFASIIFILSIGIAKKLFHSFRKHIAMHHGVKLWLCLGGDNA